MTPGYPLEFFLATALVLGLIAEAILHLERSWSRPAVAVYLTAGTWYLLDYVYNGSERFRLQFADDTLRLALLQVCLFLAAYRGWLEVVIRRSAEEHPSSVSVREADLWATFLVVGVAAIAFAGIGLIRTGGDPMNLFFPPAAEVHQFLWARGGVGQGFDFLVSAIGYTHVAAVGILGVIAAVTTDPRTRLLAVVAFAMASPPFLFQQARNQILAVVAPGLFAFMLNRRISVAMRVTVAAVAFVAINAWLLFILSYRSAGNDWAQADIEVLRTGSSVEQHVGLDMLSELCHISDFIDAGTYTPNYGTRYFAEAVALVPRAVWSDKPFIGIDYAVARGFGDNTGAAGVNTTVATGMIGQGVVNFGRVLGPIVAAGLMALWTLVLARLWEQRADFLRLCLFMVGLGLTFNMGRDITLLVLFPFVFGWIGVAASDRLFHRQGR